MKKRNYFVLLFFFLIATNSYSQSTKYTSHEKEEINLFKNFKNYISNCINNKEDITDSSHLNYIVSNFVFINAKIDSSEPFGISLNNLNPQQLTILKKTVNTFYRFLQERGNKKLSENLMAMPIRLSDDKFIFQRFTTFQKNNSLVFFDKREPAKSIGYILFIPSIKNINPTPKIWSWSLMFKFGKFMFESATGEEGYEYIFSSAKFN